MIDRRPALLSLGHRFALLTTAALLSDLGSQTTQVALSLYIFKLSGQNPSYLGLNTMAMFVPMALASPFGGVLAERYSRRRIMIANDLVRIPLVLALGLTGRIWILFALEAAIAASTALFTPSRSAFLPEIVDAERLNLANSISSGALSLVHMMGPPLGALLFIASDGLAWVVRVDASSYAISALLIALIRHRPAPRAQAAAASVLNDIVDGLGYAWRTSDVRMMLVLMLTGGAAMGLTLPLLRPFVGQSLGGGDALYKQLLFSFGLGGVIGPFAGYVIGRRLGLGLVLWLGFAIEAALLLVWAQVTDVTWSCVVLFTWGLNVFAFIPCQVTYLQTYVDKAYLGRTFALFEQVGFLPMIAGAGVVAMVGAYVPAWQVLTVAAVCYLAVVLAALGSSGTRVMIGRRGPQATAVTVAEAGS